MPFFLHDRSLAHSRRSNSNVWNFHFVTELEYSWCSIFSIGVLPSFLSRTHIHTPTQSQSCPPSSYANSSEPPLVCLPCQTCSPGEGAASPCEGTNDTVCAPCKENHYSKLTAIGRECIKCESCGEERSEVSPCTATQNAVCGSCAPGYFLYIDNGGSVCEQCSKCPADRVVVHWIECAEASRPLDQQCAPGLYHLLLI